MTFSTCPNPGDPTGKERSTFPAPQGSRLSLHRFEPQGTPLCARGGATHPWLQGAKPWSCQSWWPWRPEFIGILTKSREKSHPWNSPCFAHAQSRDLPPSASLCFRGLRGASRGKARAKLSVRVSIPAGITLW